MPIIAIGLAAACGGRSWISQPGAGGSPPVCRSHADCPPGQECFRNEQCRPRSRSAFCGDGILDAAAEECDDGNNRPGDGCSPACRRDVPICGDGTVDPGEICDDGNAVDGDTCSTDCQTACPSCLCAVYVDDAPGIAVRDGSSWSTAFATVQEGVDLAFATGPTCEVWVAGGTYRTSAGRTIALRNGSQVYGGFAGTETQRAQRDWAANPTVLQVEYVGPPNEMHAVLTASSISGVVVDGFIIEGASQRALEADGAELTLRNAVVRAHTGDYGAALHLKDSSVTLWGCEFHGNRAYTWGACIFVDGTALTIHNGHFHDNYSEFVGSVLDGWSSSGSSTSSLVMTNTLVEDEWNGEGPPISGPGPASIDGCLFRNNFGSYGGALATSSETTIANSHFLSNDSATWHGGGAIKTNGTLTIDNCLFEGNVTDTGALWPDGGGGAIHNAGTLIVTNTRFRENGAGAPLGEGGGAVRNIGDATFSNCTFLDNGALEFGGAIDNGGRLQITNATFHGNATIREGDLSIYNSGRLIVTNSILDDGIPIDGLGPVVVTYSLVRGGWPGSGNIDVDPLFVDPAAGDLHLQAASLCIDAADGTAAPPTDLEGNPRHDVSGVANGGVGTPPYADMGAYEYQE